MEDEEQPPFMKDLLNEELSFTPQKDSIMMAKDLANENFIIISSKGNGGKRPQNYKNSPSHKKRKVENNLFEILELVGESG